MPQPPRLVEYREGKYAVQAMPRKGEVAIMGAIDHDFSLRGHKVPIEGTTYELLSSDDMTQRLTLTRAVLLGPFALLLKKKTEFDYLVVTAADGRVYTVPVPRKAGGQARAFVSKMAQGFDAS